MSESALQRSQRLRDETEHFPYLDEYDDPRPDPEPAPREAPVLDCIVCDRPGALVAGACATCMPRWHGRLL